MTLLTLVPLALLAALLLVFTGALPYKVYVVRTGSMGNTIPPKSAVIVREGEFRVGEVVTFKVNGSPVTHRLLAIHADGTIDTKGDANRTMDPWHVPTSAIIGHVVAAPRMVGYWLIYLKSPMGIASILLFCLLIWQIVTFPATREEDLPCDEEEEATVGLDIMEERE